MPILEYAGGKILLDDEGYLENPDDWNEKVACAFAEKEGIEELTKDRMEIIRFLRDHYRKYNFFNSVMKTVLPHDEFHTRVGGLWLIKKGDDVIVPHYPYTENELAANPELKDNFYNVGGYLWFKKANK